MATAWMAAMNAKLEPRYTGTLRPVMKWNSSVPRPAHSSAVDGLRPVSAGTSTVAPNIANTCWMPRMSSFPTESLRITCEVMEKKSSLSLCV